MKTKYNPVIGEVYGKWTVISDTVRQGGGHAREALWEVRCECGYEKWIMAYTLRHGSSNGCVTCGKQSANICGDISSSYYHRIEKRAKQIRLDYDLTPEYIWGLFLEQEGKCALSGLELKFDRFWRKDCDQTASLDRIDSNIGYVRGNVQWLHKDVNNMKHTHNQNYFLELCRKIAENIC